MEKCMELEDEQWDLLDRFVEAHRNAPADARAAFLESQPMGQAHSTFFHLIVPSLRFGGSLGDAEVLADLGLLRLSYNSQGNRLFYVTPAGIRCYENRKRESPPAASVEHGTREFLTGPDARERHPSASALGLGFPAAPPQPTSIDAGPRVDRERPCDLFLSHASEDKGAIARPLYQALTAAGVTVWFDDAVLKLGDSLRQKIDEGLGRCRYGVVVLSPSFFAKRWPQRELDGLVAKETASGEKAILPIWHEVDRDDVFRYSPPLADRLAARSSEGIPSVVAKILDALGRR
jgi:hypothetical protein